MAAAIARLRRRRYTGVCGVNIGKNAATPLEQATCDYVAALQAVYEYADYVTINISSPNTQGLRQLQEGRATAPTAAGAAGDARRAGASASAGACRWW